MEKINNITFVDGIANLSFSSGAFRFDLAAIKPGARPNKDPNKVEIETQGHIIMTPQAFIQTFKAMESFVKLVEEKGIIRFSEQTDAKLAAE